MKSLLQMAFLIAFLVCACTVSLAQGRTRYYHIRALGGPLVSVRADARVSVNQLYNVRDVHGCTLEPEDADNYPYAEYLIPVGTKASGSKSRRWLAAANAEWQRKLAYRRTRFVHPTGVHPAATATPLASPTPPASGEATPYLPKAGAAVTTTNATGIYFVLHPTLHLAVGERRNVYYVVGYGSTVKVEGVSMVVRSLSPAEQYSPAPSPGSSVGTPQASMTPPATAAVMAGLSEPGIVWIEALRPGSAEVRLETRDRTIMASIPVLVQATELPLSGLFNTVLLWGVIGACLAALVWALRTFYVRYRHQP